MALETLIAFDASAPLRAIVGVDFEGYLAPTESFGTAPSRRWTCTYASSAPSAWPDPGAARRRARQSVPGVDCARARAGVRLVRGRVLISCTIGP